MSHHFVLLEREGEKGLARVELGWDRPLHEFYLVIFEEPPAGQQDNAKRIVYSNLDDPSSVGVELDYFKKIAIKLGFKVPDSMWRAAYQDQQHNVVNKSTYYSPNGDVIKAF